MAAAVFAVPGAAAIECPHLGQLHFQAHGTYLTAPLDVLAMDGSEWTGGPTYTLQLAPHETGLVVEIDWVTETLTVRAGDAAPGNYVLRLRFTPWEPACPGHDVTLIITVTEDATPPPQDPDPPSDPTPPQEPEPPVTPQPKRVPGWDGVCPRLETTELSTTVRPGEAAVFSIRYAEGGTTWSHLLGSGIGHWPDATFDSATGTVTWVPTEEGSFSGTIVFVTGQPACDAQVHLDVTAKEPDAPLPPPGTGCTDAAAQSAPSGAAEDGEPACPTEDARHAESDSHAAAPTTADGIRPLVPDAFQPVQPVQPSQPVQPVQPVPRWKSLRPDASGVGHGDLDDDAPLQPTGAPCTCGGAPPWLEAALAGPGPWTAWAAWATWAAAGALAGLASTVGAAPWLG